MRTADSNTTFHILQQSPRDKDVPKRTHSNISSKLFPQSLSEDVRPAEGLSPEENHGSQEESSKEVEAPDQARSGEGTAQSADDSTCSAATTVTATPPRAVPLVQPSLLKRKEFFIPAPVSGLTPAGHRHQLDEQRGLFFAFIADFFNLDRTEVTVAGLQSSFGASCGDQILLLLNDGGSFCVPVNLLMEPVDIARTLVAAEISKFERSFNA